MTKKHRQKLMEKKDHTQQMRTHRSYGNLNEELNGLLSFSIYIYIYIIYNVSNIKMELEKFKNKK